MRYQYYRIEGVWMRVGRVCFGLTPTDIHIRRTYISYVLKFSHSTKKIYIYSVGVVSNIQSYLLNFLTSR